MTTTPFTHETEGKEFVNLFPQDKGDIFKMTETPAGVVLISDNRQYLYDSVDKVIESKKWFIINEV